jgi:beta-phosphoglucomutase-like phosphatase (HAD superfamily)
VPSQSHEILPALMPPDGVRALLFDCDGTLLDTLGVYKESWRGPFSRRGFVLTDEWFYARAGLSMDPFILAALPNLDEAELRAVELEGMASFYEQLHSVERFEHVVDVARAFTGTLPVGVVSAGRKDAVERSLEAGQIRDLFDFVIALDDVELPKPAPDCYLLAVERLGLSPREVLAYEDSDAGVAAARAAGIQVIDVRGT